MRQSITTKYLGPTNSRGARVKATSASGMSVTLTWDDAMGLFENHTAAALALATQLKWAGQWQGGTCDVGCVFVPLDSIPTFTLGASHGQ